jgi:hypothetical protein
MTKNNTYFIPIMKPLIILGVACFLTHAEYNAMAQGATGNGVPSASPSPGFVQKPDGPYEPRDPRWKAWHEKEKRDPDFEWKTPIAFYGKVVDEDGNPVQGAKLKIIGTDDSPSGNFYRMLISDSYGSVSLRGVHGNGFDVQLSKEGYYTPEEGNRSSFEYAEFFDPDYYVPDPKNPVIFHLRKIGKPATLLTVEGKFVLTFGRPFTIRMPAGFGTASSVQVNVFQNEKKTHTWKAQISVNNGGVQVTAQEFPFDAPTSGYKPSLDIDQNTKHPLDWQDIYYGGHFYIKLDKGYGLLELRQMISKRTLHYSLLINPVGERNLEPAPTPP